MHRIGRTGRANTYGTAITFFTEDNGGKVARDLIKVLEEARQQVDPALYDLMRAGREPTTRGRSGRRYGRQW